MSKTNEAHLASVVEAQSKLIEKMRDSLKPFAYCDGTSRREPCGHCANCDAIFALSLTVEDFLPKEKP